MPAGTAIFWTTCSFGPAGRNGTSSSSLTVSAPAVATTRSFAPPTGSCARAWNTIVSFLPLSSFTVAVSLPRNASGSGPALGRASPATARSWLSSFTLIESGPPDRFVMNTGIWTWSFWVMNRGNVTWTTIGSLTVTSASARPTRVPLATTAMTRTWPRYDGIWNGTVIVPSGPTGTMPENSATGLTGWTRPLP